MVYKVIAHIAQYSAPYMGNFINSLIALETQLYAANVKTVYVFPESCRNTQWISLFMCKRTVYFIKECTGGKIFISRQLINQISEICIKENVDMIHTHFDGYDIAAVLADKYQKHVQVIWHYHNAREYMPDFIRRVYQKMMFFRHYGFYGKKAWLISVSEHYLTWIHKLGFSEQRSTFIPNGIDLKRVNYKRTINCSQTKNNTFLAFGGSGDTKGVDILLAGVKLLIAAGTNFSLMLVKGSDTSHFVSNNFGDNIPENLHIIEPVADVNQLFEQADYFISCSRRETFSYAVAEAIAYGLPVLCSDIPGTSWVKELASVKTFDLSNIHNMVERCMELTVENKNALSQQCNESRQFIVNNYTAEKWSQKVIGFYDTIG